MTKVAHSSSVPLPLTLLWLGGWPPAAQVFWSQIAGIESVPRGELTAEFWSRDKERCKRACLTLADMLFAAGRGVEALAALMLAADPAEPQTFEILLPQLAYAVEHFWDWPTARVTRHHSLERLAVWWRAARGDFEEDGSSIFWITRMEMLDQDDSSEEPAPAHEPDEPAHENEPEGPGIVVMPSDKATKLNNFHTEFAGLVDAKLPLRLAGDLGAVRRTLIAEYPHAVGAIDLVLRGLREGQPVRWTPILLTGPAGAGKSRLVRRIADLLGIGVYRYDGAGASDAMFGGSPKAWGNTVPSAAARAVNQLRIANPILLVEELEKAGTSSRNGRLWDVMLVYLDRETARVRDVSLDSVLDLSGILHIATANSIENLPDPLRDRYRIVKVPAPRLADLPQLAANVLRELAVETGEQGFVCPLANDELAVIGRAWEKARFSLRTLQKIVAATIEVRNATAVRH
jgi:ATP-dependent Lon protease